MKFRISTVALVALLVGCANGKLSGGPIPGSNIKPKELLLYTHEKWLSQVAREYQCRSPKVIEVQPNNTGVAGVISEKWVADVCGQKKTFVPILAPDGMGGYLTAIGSTSDK